MNDIKVIDNGALEVSVKERLLELTRQEKAIKEEKEALTASLLQAMEANNVVKIDSEEITVTYIAPTYKESFDSKALKADDEATYNKYIKISPVKASIRVKVK